MLKSNLSTRPFYNERLVSLVIIGLIVCAAALSAFNVQRLLGLSAERQALNERINQDRSAAATIRESAARMQQGVDRTVLARLAGSAREANQLIDQRTFSWTVLFGLIEDTLPINARLVSVSPSVNRGVFRVALTVVARDLADIDTFIDALMDTGAFYDVAPSSQQSLEDGTVTALIQAPYLPPAAPAAAPATPEAAR